ANGARRLVAVTICSERPADAGFGYLPLFGEDSLMAGDGEVDVATPSGMLRFMPPQWLERRYRGAGEIPAVAAPWPAAMTIAVDDLDRAAGVLARRGIAFHAGETNLVIPAAAATGTILELVSA